MYVVEITDVCVGVFILSNFYNTPQSYLLILTRFENVFMLDHKRNEMLIESDKSCVWKFVLHVESPASSWLIVSQKLFAQDYICDIWDILSFKMGILPVWLKLWGCKKVLVESWAELMCLDWNRLRISTVTALIDSLRLFDEHQSTYTCILFRMVRVRI